MMKTLCTSLLVSISMLLFISFTSCKQTDQKSVQGNMPIKVEQKPVQHNIPIKVAIIYNAGGAQAVARENFYLLNKDAVQIWKEAGLISDEKRFGFDFRLERLSAIIDKKTSKFEEAIKPYIVNTTTSDFEGNATFENVSEGNYYIYGATDTRGGCAVWSYKVSSNEGKTVFLDNKNAIFAL